jgi:hypothetical protein
MSTIPQTEISNDTSDGDCHVEMTNELPTENDSIRSETVSIEESITIPGTLMKSRDESFCSSGDTIPGSPWGSFIDADNGSTESNSSWGTAIYTDMRFTMMSNALFLVGGIIQTYTSVVDLKSAKAETSEDDDWGDDDYDDDWDCDDDYVYTIADKTWYVFYSLGPFLYIMNAIVDVKWLTAHGASIWQWKFWCPWCRRNDDSSVEIENLELQGPYQHIVDDDSSYSSIDSIETSYGTEIAWQLVAAFIFGLGAFFEFYSTFLADYYEDEDDWDDDEYLIEMENQRKWYVSNYKIDFLAMHLYFLSGLIMLIAQRNSYRSGCKFGCCLGDLRRLFFGSQDGDDQAERDSDAPDENNPTESSNQLAEFLMFLGTLLFVCGTFLDVSIAYMSDPKIRHQLDPNEAYLNLNQLTLAICDLISSSLWNVDAVLYICADVLLYSLHKKGSKGRQWLCKKRAIRNCSEEDTVDDYMEEGDAEELVYRENEEPGPMLPELDPIISDTMPLLSDSSVTTYSSF